MQTTVSNDDGSTITIVQSHIYHDLPISTPMSLSRLGGGEERHLLTLGNGEQRADYALTSGQLEQLHTAIGVYLREQDAAARHVDPVTGCPFCPPVQLPEGETWGIGRDERHHHRGSHPYRAIVSNRTGVVYADGLALEEAEHILEGLQDQTQTVQIAE